MAPQVYLRTGEVRAVPEAAAVRMELVVTTTGFRRMLVCRGVAGDVPARFDAHATLA